MSNIDPTLAASPVNIVDETTGVAAGVTAGGRLLVDASLVGGTPSPPYEDYLTGLGKMFAVNAEDVNLPSKTVYNSLLVIENPAGSGKTIKIWDWNFNVVSATASRFEIKLGATFTAGTGTALTPLNQLSGSAIASIANVRVVPTVLTPGVGFKEVAQAKGADSLWIPASFTTHLPPGRVLLVQGLPDALNSLVTVSVKWCEL